MNPYQCKLHGFNESLERCPACRDEIEKADVANGLRFLAILVVAVAMLCAGVALGLAA